MNPHFIPSGPFTTPGIRWQWPGIRLFSAFAILSSAPLLPSATAGRPHTFASPSANPLPSISITVSPGAINEGNDSIFTVSTSRVNPLHATTILYSMTGTAQPGVDYTMDGVMGRVDIPPN